MTTSAGPTFAAFINREIRRVPFDWRHPTDETGQSVPLLHSGYYTAEEIAELVSEGQTERDIASREMPDFSDVPAERLGLCVYETTTEGTPVSPVFPDTPQGREALLDYCATHVTAFADRRIDRARWAEVLFGKGGVVFLTGDRTEAAIARRYEDQTTED